MSKDTWQGDVTVENETQAQAKAKGALKEKNKDKITGSITVAGNVKLVAGEVLFPQYLLDRHIHHRSHYIGAPIISQEKTL